MFTKEDLKLLAKNKTEFAIRHRKGYYYFDNYSKCDIGREYIDLVHVFDNGMKPATNGTIEEFVDFFNQKYNDNNILWISPNPFRF